MRELDFLPDWYRADRRNRRRRQHHYVLFGVVVALLAGWSFIVGRSVSGLQAETQFMEQAMEEGQQTLEAAAAMEEEIQRLRGRVETLALLSHRTAITAVLGELSCCVGENMILSRVVLAQEPVAEAQSDTAGTSGGVVRIGAARSAAPGVAPKMPQQVRVTLTGIAGGGGDVAQLIERLESSAYFGQVSPGFSRAKTVGSRTVTEFEISCVVADFKIQR